MVCLCEDRGSNVFDVDCLSSATRNRDCAFVVLRRFLFHQVMFEGEHGGRHPYGDIAIDDVSFSPECRSSRHGRLMSHPSFMS